MPRYTLPLLFFTLSLAAFLAFRIWNLPTSSYFIYDQGRDMAKWAELAAGNPTLVGPTTGLSGLFLGPLWYYLGFPGYLLSGGQPLGVMLWFISLSALAFPLYWWLSHRLFWSADQSSQSLLTWLLTGFSIGLFIVLPASLSSSTTIWNPLLGTPLMLLALYAGWRVRGSRRPRWWLAGLFLAVALTLQSEFAYAVFFLPVLFVLVPWLQQRSWRQWRPLIGDWLVALAVVGLTLVPQLLFELRHDWIMTRSLWQGLTDASRTVSWAEQFQQRPRQLLDTTVDFFTGPDQNDGWVSAIVLLPLLIGLVSCFRPIRLLPTASSEATLFLRRFLAIMVILPYPFYLLWRGNEGNFFSYYLTSHFAFVLPMWLLGLQALGQPLWSKAGWRPVAAVILVAAVTPIWMASVQHWVASVVSPLNQAGLARMQQAVKLAHQWQASELANATATMVITPNMQSVHYDYLFGWQGRQVGQAPPRTVPRAGDQQLILVTEYWQAEPSDYMKHQRKTLLEHQGWQLQRLQLVGAIVVEDWRRAARAGK